MAGLAAAFGSGAMTNSIDDIGTADVILITGSNTTEMHPIIALEVKKAVKRGSKLIVVDPRQIEIVNFADIWLRQRPGTDVAWINGFMHIIIKEELYDKKFVEERTEGFEELKETVEKYTPEYVEKITGIPKDELIEAARLYAKADRATILYAMGITQHISGTDNVKSLANLAMLTGNVGREGTGVNPLRGQNNVQGACDMGALPNVFPGYQKVTDDKIREKFEKAWGVKLSGKVGLPVTEMIDAIEEGKIKALYIMGENPALSDPDLQHVLSCLKKLDFLVVQDIFLTETAELADVVLPGCSFAEKDGTFTNTERRIQLIRKAIKPIGNSKPDWEIICELSKRMGYEMNYSHPREIMDEISSLTPIYGGIKYYRLENGGLQWPCLDETHPGTKILHKDKFARGKGKFHAIEYIEPAELPDDEYPFLLSTGRVLAHFHTGTMTRKVKAIDWLIPECLVEMNPIDAEELDIFDQDKVRITSRRGSIEAKVFLTERVPPKMIFIPFHFKEAAANILTISALDPVAKIPEYKVAAVKIEKI